jgi:hypothetical protein
VLLTLVAACASALASPALAVEFTDPARLAVETDAIIDRVSTAPLDLSLPRWTAEILPWFTEEAIVRVEREPVRVAYADFGGRSAEHMLGGAHCRSGVVLINARYANPVSTLYRSVDMVLTLTHELAHVQQDGLCERVSTAALETAAQLMAFEVDAAMALAGNVWAGLALLRELRALAVGVLVYNAQRGVAGAREQLDRVTAAIYTGEERARVAQHERYRSKSPAESEENLLTYLVKPYRKLVAAFQNDTIAIGLATPVTHQRPWAAPPTGGSLWLDDLAYFVTHAAAIYP